MFVGYVEFTVPDERHTAAFYREVFGWEPTELFTGYLSVESGEARGVNTGIERSDDGSASTVASIIVDDLDAAMARVEANGGTVTEPRFTIPGVGDACYFEDVNGMKVGMWEANTSAS